MGDDHAVRLVVGKIDLGGDRPGLVEHGQASGIGKPDLRYQQFPYDQVQQVLMQLGVPPKGAAMYIEMYKAINAGVLVPLEPRSKENGTPTSVEQFVQDAFAPAYHTKASRV